MADDVYTTLLNFVSEDSEAAKSIKRLTGEIKLMEEEMAKVAKSSDLKDIDRWAELRNKIALERSKINSIEVGQLREQKKIEQEMAVVSGERTKRQFEQIKANSVLLAEFNRRTQGQNIRDIPDIQNDILREAPALIKATENARKSELREAIRAQQIKIALYNREANVLRKTASDIRENAQIIRNQAQQLQGISQLALGAGVGVVGGIFAFATKYVRDAKEATSVTRAWKAEQDELARSGQKIGAVFAQEALPLLRLASDTAAKAAGFIEKHPEIVRAALNAGIVVAGLGAVGLAVSKGIRLYADQLYLSSIPLQLEAGRLQFAAAQEQLIAARMRAGLSVGEGGGAATKVAGGGALGTAITSPLGIAALITATGIASFKAASSLQQLEDRLVEVGGGKMTPVITFFNTLLTAVSPLVPAIKTLRNSLERDLPLIQKLINQFTGGGGASVGGTGTKGGRPGAQDSTRFASSEIRERALGFYEDYMRDDLALVQKHYADRAKVVSDSLKAEAKSDADFARDSARISANLGKGIASATRNYEEASRKAEIQNAQERARIIRDGGIEIQRIEENLQENLRKLRLGHEDRLADLVAARDALGIVKENRRYNQERAEQIRETNLEIRQRRADLALRLQDLQQSFQQERAERLADLQERLAELRANAQEQQKELAARHRDEIIQIRAQRTERIKELDAQFKEERKRRYDYFVDQLRNLDAGLLGEKKLRLQRQQEMLVDLDKFLVAYKTRLATLSTSAHATPVNRARGGYAAYGTYLLGDAAGGGRGKPEYVLNGNVTELAERVLGGRISQDKMAAMFGAMNGGSSKSVTYNDNRRLDGRITAAERNRMVNDSLDAFGTILEGM